MPVLRVPKVPRVVLAGCDRRVPDVASPCLGFPCLRAGSAALMEQCVSPVEVFLFSKASSTLWTHGSVWLSKNQPLFLDAPRAGIGQFGVFLAART